MMMHSSAAHIVHKLSWKTSINDKELAPALQNKLSGWTNFQFNSELKAVFERYNPLEQNWIIPKLEVDLGTVAYENIEEVLAQKLPQLIEEQLKQMAFKQQIQNQQNEGYFSEPESQLKVLQSLLEEGILPWWYKARKEVSLQEVFLACLKQSSDALRTFLLDKAKNAKVRQRLAFQLKDESLKKIVQLVEPTNHEEILSFQMDLIQIQKESTEIKGEEKDLKKALWYWVLTYLFEERGSFFNKLEYMESLLIQMAAHFNMDVKKLLRAVQQTLIVLQKSTTIPKDFVLMIEQLVERNEHRIETKSTSNQDIIWETFEFAVQHNTISEFAKEYNLSTFLVEQISRNPKPLILFLNKIEVKLFFEVFKSLENRVLSVALKEVLLVQNNSHFQVHIQFVEKHLFSEVGEKEKKQFKIQLLQFLLQGKQKPSVASLYNQFCVSSAQKQKLLKGIEDSTQSAKSVGFQSEVRDWYLAQLYSDEKGFEVAFEQLLQSVSNQADKKLNLIRLTLLIEKEPQKSFQFLKKYHDASGIKALIEKDLSAKAFDFILQQHPLFNQLTNRLNELLSFEKSKEFQLEWEVFQELFLRKCMSTFLQNHEKGVLNALETAFHTLLNQYFNSANKAFKAWLNEFKDLELWKEVQFNIKAKVQEFENWSMQDRLSFYQSRKEFEAYEVCVNALHIQGKLSKEAFESAIQFYFGKTYNSIFEKFGLKNLAFRKSLNTAQQKTFEKALQSILLDYSSHQGQLKGVDSALQDLLAFYQEPLIKKKIEKSPEKEDQKTTQSIQQLFSQSPNSSLFNDLWCMYALFNPLLTEQNLADYELVFKEEISQAHLKSKEEVLRAILKRLHYLLKLEQSRQIDLLVKEWKQKAPHLTAFLAHFLISKQKGVFELLYKQEQNAVLQEFKVLHQSHQFEVFCRHLIQKGELPSFAASLKVHSKKDLILTISQNYPILFLQILKEREYRQISDLKHLIPFLRFEKIIQLIACNDVSSVVPSSALLQINQSFRFVTSSKLKSTRLQAALYFLLLKAWQSNQWKLFNPNHFWQELIHLLLKETSLTQFEIVEELVAQGLGLPIWYQKALNEKANTQIQSNQNKKVNNMPTPYFTEKDLEERPSIAIRNAGLVILSAYMPMLFERMDILDENRQFKKDCQSKAANVLQFVATGMQQTEELNMPLNKVLVGLPIDSPIDTSVDLTKDEIELIEGMVKAVINYWSAIGESSVEGFRGNWLVRDGLLREEVESWELNVEKRAYDILLNQSPFSFSIIKHPWMEKAIHVNWPY